MSKAKKFDAGKPPLSRVPLAIVEGIAEVLEFGANKYGWDNWKQGFEDADHRLLSGVLRHIYKYLDGEKVDIDYVETDGMVEDKGSGLSHLKHAACGLLFLLYFQKNELPLEVDELITMHSNALGKFMKTKIEADNKSEVISIINNLPEFIEDETNE